MAKTNEFQVTGTIKHIAGSGKCPKGHKVGDTFKLSTGDSAGLCTNFFILLWPYIMTLQFGGKFPTRWVRVRDEGTAILCKCTDEANIVTLELRRGEPLNK